MKREDYVATVNQVAGGIKAIVGANAPCTPGCQAHPGNQQINILHAEKYKADADWIGSKDMTDEIARTLADGLKAGVTVQVAPEKTYSPFGKEISASLVHVVVLAVLMLLSTLVNVYLRHVDTAAITTGQTVAAGKADESAWKQELARAVAKELSVQVKALQSSAAVNGATLNRVDEHNPGKGDGG